MAVGITIADPPRHPELDFRRADKPVEEDSLDSVLKWKLNFALSTAVLLNNPDGQKPHWAGGRNGWAEAKPDIANDREHSQEEVPTIQPGTESHACMPLTLATGAGHARANA